MFDALDRADKYRKGGKTKKRSPKFHMIGEQSSNPPEFNSGAIKIAGSCPRFYPVRGD